MSSPVAAAGEPVVSGEALDVCAAATSDTTSMADGFASGVTPALEPGATSQQAAAKTSRAGASSVADSSGTGAPSGNPAVASSSTPTSQMDSATTEAPEDGSAFSVALPLEYAASCSSSESSRSSAWYLPDETPGLLRLSRALSSISDTGSAYAFDSYVLPAPGLCVRGMSEPLAFPFVPVQAEELATLSKVCPHEHGLHTVVDADVTGCLQIEPEMLTFQNGEWEEELNELFADACLSLGVPKAAVQCELYTLLLYRKGGHLKEHVDTEKTKGMFATLTVQLPSSFKGGEAVFRHGGQEEVFRGGADDGTSGFKYFYSTFYSDAEHENRPIEEGYRLTLVYNLLWTGNGSVPSAKADGLAEVASALQEHAEKSPAGDWHLAFMLEHEYTSRSISGYGTGALKGVDRRNVGALKGVERWGVVCGWGRAEYWKA